MKKLFVFIIIPLFLFSCGESADKEEEALTDQEIALQNGECWCRIMRLTIDESSLLSVVNPDTISFYEGQYDGYDCDDVSYDTVVSQFLNTDPTNYQWMECE